MMLMQQTPKRKFFSSLGMKLGVALSLTGLTLFGATQQALAHHPFGGDTPSNFAEAFLSGMGHPVIGLDHFAFVVASGLLAVQLQRGIFIPLGFVLAAMLGTGIHLLAVDLPAAELLIAGSVVAVGALIAWQTKKDLSEHSLLLAVAAGVAGLFHGYAYGEAIIGAEMGPVIAYLVGFSVIQVGIAGAAYKLGQVVLQYSQKRFPVMRFLGLAISGIGIVFLGTSLVG
jgi:urease accessory protein